MKLIEKSIAFFHMFDANMFRKHAYFDDLFAINALGSCFRTYFRMFLKLIQRYLLFASIGTY